MARRLGPVARGLLVRRPSLNEHDIDAAVAGPGRLVISPGIHGTARGLLNVGSLHPALAQVVGRALRAPGSECQVVLHAAARIGAADESDRITLERSGR